MSKSIKPSRKPAAVSKKSALPKRATVTVDDLGPKPKTKTAKEGDAGRPRRTIFIDVENTSGEAALIAALDQLEIDRSMMPTELVAVGNWRVIGQHVARMLARRGARLLHTAPATGVKDWSDLSIAVAAGIWLGRARAGDQVEIVSADRAFDAVADAAAHLGVKFRRLTYGSLSGLAEAIAVTPAQAAGGNRRRSRRGGRSRRRHEPGVPWSPGAPTMATTLPAADLPTPVQAAPASNGAEQDIQGASHEHIVATIARLTARAPDRGVNLDLLINALKEEGFGRPPGSPRLVTRLRKMKDVEVSPTGMVRLLPGTIVVPSERTAPVSAAVPEPSAEAVGEASGETKTAKKPRRRGGRGRRRPTKAGSAAAGSTVEASAES